jgi:phosphoenolpyruvate carboxylase
MSTQHPDNAMKPSWAEGDVIEGEAELREAFSSYKDLGCDEVMWDSEGKDVDTHVVRKLFSTYPEYFQEHVIGEQVFLTYRVPNPQVEVAEKKVFTETLQTIPLSADVASVFLKRKVVPVFEVILPFTTSGKELVLLSDYYRKAIAGVERMKLVGSVTVKDWVGDFRPKEIEVIPLVEDMQHLLLVDRLVKEYIQATKVKHMRVFIARSDPALNYGLIPAVLLSKIALSKLRSVEKETGVHIHPMIGVGSLPFRGHLSPTGVADFLVEYRGLSTVTVQSAFRYDYPLQDVKNGVSALNSNLPNGEARVIDPEEEQQLRLAMDKLTAAYQSRVEALAPFINSISQFVPRRRARKLHIGLFGYSRSVRGKAMPRAIPFAASFYSVGIPPEFIGASALSELGEREWSAFERAYVNAKKDFSAVGALVSWQTANMMLEMHRKVAKVAGIESERFRESLAKLVSDLSAVEESLSVKLGPRDNASKKHENFTSNFLISYTEKDDAGARDAFIQAARLRRSIG